MVHKKFMDIQRIKENYAEGFHKGEISLFKRKLTVQIVLSDMILKQTRL